VLLPEVTLRVTGIVTTPAYVRTLTCPMKRPAGRRAAVAVTVMVVGLAEVTVELPVRAADRKFGESVTTFRMLRGVELVVDRVTLCDAALSPDCAVNVRVGGFAVRPTPAGGVTTKVTGTVCTMPLEFSEIVPVYVPGARPVWFTRTSSVWVPTRLPLGCTVSHANGPP
jgi:hypothetical protein